MQWSLVNVINKLYRFGSEAVQISTLYIVTNRYYIPAPSGSRLKAGMTAVLGLSKWHCAQNRLAKTITSY
jgi:hypothetical protein